MNAKQRLLLSAPLDVCNADAVDVSDEDDDEDEDDGEGISTLHSYCAHLLSSLSDEEQASLERRVVETTESESKSNRGGDDELDSHSLVLLKAHLLLRDRLGDEEEQRANEAQANANQPDQSSRRRMLLIVDEAQDTSTIQWRILRLLCSRPGDIVTVVLIGDAAQSIYRFARSDSLPFQKPQLHFLPQITWHHHRLTRNYRSTPAICALLESLSQRLYVWNRCVDDVSQDTRNEEETALATKDKPIMLIEHMDDRRIRCGREGAAQGVMPRLHLCADSEAHVETLRRLVDDALQRHRTIWILLRTKAALSSLHRQLSDHLGDRARVCMTLSTVEPRAPPPSSDSTLALAQESSAAALASRHQVCLGLIHQAKVFFLFSLFIDRFHLF
jgi:hypothetical protein